MLSASSTGGSMPSLQIPLLTAFTSLTGMRCAVRWPRRLPAALTLLITRLAELDQSGLDPVDLIGRLRNRQR
jgi:hypothetical protein